MNKKSTVNLAVEATTWAVVIGAGLVIIAAGILSFSALKDLFGMMGLFPDWLAWLFPLLFDLTEVSFALAVWPLVPSTTNPLKMATRRACLLPARYERMIPDERWLRP